MSSSESVTNEWPKQDFVFTNGIYVVKDIHWSSIMLYVRRSKEDKKVVSPVVNEWPMDDQNRILCFPIVFLWSKTYNEAR